MTRIELYQSVLKKLSIIPLAYLEEIDSFLSKLIFQVSDSKQTDQSKIMAFAGSWSDMDNSDFEDYWQETRNVRENLFNRNIEL